MQAHSLHRWFNLPLLVALAATIALDAARADFLEPDKLKYTMGEWKISTARWGHGCVAELTYNKDTESYVSIGGKTKTEMYFLVTLSPNTVGRSGADDLLNSLHNPELALRRDRYSAEPWTYRDKVGVSIQNLPAEFLDDLSASKRLRYTENGYEKLSINLNNIREALPSLVKCIQERADN